MLEEHKTRLFANFGQESSLGFFLIPQTKVSFILLSTSLESLQASEIIVQMLIKKMKIEKAPHHHVETTILGICSTLHLKDAKKHSLSKEAALQLSLT